MRRLAFIFALLIGFATGLRAQDDPEYRMEIGAGIGMGGYLGDFNGSLTKDLKPAFSILAKRYISPWAAIRLNFSYAKMKGSSADVETYYPDYADNPYTFDNSLYDLNATFEYNFWPYGTGYDYRGSKRVTPFVFGGLGMAFCKTADKTKAAFQVPLGLGLKMKLADRLNLGVEWGVTFTSSDWLDGVKDPYYVKSSGLFKNTDCHSLLQVTLTYSFMPKCVNCMKE